MSLDDCLNRAAEAGEVSRAHAREASKQFTDLVARYRRSMPQHAAEAAALRDLKEATRRAARSRFHAVVHQLATARELVAQIEGAADPIAAFRNLIESSPDDRGGYTGKSVRSLADAYKNHVNTIIAGILEKHSTDVLGRVRNRVTFEQLIDEAHGADTGNASARELAGALGEAQEFLRRKFNELGGDIGKLDHYGLPHSHDAAQLIRVGPDRWIDDILPLLDWSRIEDLRTGRMFADSPDVTPPRDAVEPFLRGIYDSITTAGWNKADPKMTTGGKALYNQRSDRRYLHFKPRGAWLAYNRQYGVGDPFSSMIGGLHNLADDIARMEVLGPNPEGGINIAAQAMQRAVNTRMTGNPAADLARRQRASKTIWLTRSMLAEMTGEASIPASATIQSFFSGVRMLQTSAYLGSAIVSSVTDIPTAMVAARMVGMRPTNVISRAVSLMASPGQREVAAQAGYISEALADGAAAYSRFMGQTLRSGIPERLASFTLRVSGLQFWTSQARLAFKMEFAAHLARNADRALADIEPTLRGVVTRAGITAEDWDAIRDPDHVFVARNGARFLTPHAFLEASRMAQHRRFGGSSQQAESVAMRLGAIIEEQVEFAVPSSSLETRAALRFGAKAGTWGGEAVGRSFAQFKSYPVTITIMHLRRMAALRAQGNDATMKWWHYAMMLGAGLTAFGALAVQLKEISKGRDPQPMDNPKFWLAAGVQGGGAGIFGDFFFAAQNRAGGGLLGTVAGPTVELGAQITNLVGAPIRAARGDDVNLGREAARFVGQNTPVLSSLTAGGVLPVRTLYSRGVIDNLQDFLDPEARDQWDRQARQRKREQGNADFWPRGAFAPERAPDLGTALGNAR